jgi:hypothetical protein
MFKRVAIPPQKGGTALLFTLLDMNSYETIKDEQLPGHVSGVTCERCGETFLYNSEPPPAPGDLAPPIICLSCAIGLSQS